MSTIRRLWNFVGSQVGHVRNLSISWCCIGAQCGNTDDLWRIQSPHHAQGHMETSIALPLVADRLLCTRRHAERISRLADIIFEFYRSEGPVDLLAVVKTLYRSRLNLVIVASLEAHLISLSLSQMADVLFAEYQLTDNLASLELSIKYYQKSLRVMDNVESGRCRTQIGLAHALYHRFVALSAEDDCKIATDYLENMIEGLFNEDESTQAWALAVLGLLRSNSRTWTAISVPSQETLQDILASLRRLRRIHLQPSAHILSMIAQAALLWAISSVTSTEAYLNEGLHIAKATLQLCPEHAEVLHNHILVEFAYLHLSAHQLHWGDSRAHLDTAIEIAGHQRLACLAKRNAGVRWYWLYQWGGALLERATEHEDLDIMEQAVDALKEAVAICPPTHGASPVLVTCLVYALGQHFYQSGRQSVLDELMTFHDRYPNYVARTAFFASNIAEVMLIRARIVSDATARVLIGQVLQICQVRRNAPGFAQVEKTEESSIDLQLITASRMQLQIGDMPILDIDRMLEMARHGLTTATEPSDRIGFVLAQVDMMTSVARNTGNPDILSEATHVLDHELSLESMASSIYRTDIHAAHADILVARAVLSPANTSQSLLTSAWSTYRFAATSTTTSGRARERFQACLRWASHATARGHTIDALEAYACALDILPKVVYLGEDVIGRIEALRQVSGLASSSVATALTLGDASTAIQFLERTRGIIWLQMFLIRIARLDNLLPDFIRDRLVLLTSQLEESHRMQWTVRRRAAEQLDQLVHEIRATPTFDNFLRPPALNDISLALKRVGGYAAVIVPSGFYCDVLILGIRDGHSHLRLTSLDADRITKFLHIINGSDETSSGTSKDDSRGIKMSKMDTSHLQDHDVTMMEMLSELWYLLVRPIFQEMGILNMTTNEPRRRMWWCPIGKLSAIPLHAAGIYGTSSSEHVGRYVVSSYTSTLSALHRLIAGTDAATAASTTSPKMLLVSQSSSEGFPPLPHALAEIIQVRNTLPPEALVDVPDTQSISIDTVLNALKSIDVLHLACHGQQDQENPLNSGFELRDGRLTLGRLMRVSMPHAQLAYLSACESAAIDEDRPDENLNLAGAMIFMGFKSVIATMWAMDDIDGPFMAERIYRRIFQNGVLNMAAVPYAVDDAIKELRDS